MRFDLVGSFLSQAFEDRHFRKCEISFAIPDAVASINERKSPGPGWRAEYRSTDSRRQTRMTRPNLSLGGFDPSSRYYLKLSKIDISQKFEELLNRG
jgi:hypothetical protein